MIDKFWCVFYATQYNSWKLLTTTPKTNGDDAKTANIRASLQN